MTLDKHKVHKIHMTNTGDISILKYIKKNTPS